MDIDWNGPLGTILDALAECQAISHDDKPDALARIRVELEAPQLLAAMHAVGYFPERNVPGADFT